MLNKSSNTKPRPFKMLPKWQNFPTSGHTAQEQKSKNVDKLVVYRWWQYMNLRIHCKAKNI